VNSLIGNKLFPFGGGPPTLQQAATLLGVDEIQVAGATTTPRSPRCRRWRNSWTTPSSGFPAGRAGRPGNARAGTAGLRDDAVDRPGDPEHGGQALPFDAYKKASSSRSASTTTKKSRQEPGVHDQGREQRAGDRPGVGKPRWPAPSFISSGSRSGVRSLGAGSYCIGDRSWHLPGCAVGRTPPSRQGLRSGGVHRGGRGQRVREEGGRRPSPPGICTRSRNCGR
jgi:hypothetical protein